jgi:hypothetical protein
MTKNSRSRTTRKPSPITWNPRYRASSTQWASKRSAVDRVAL